MLLASSILASPPVDAAGGDGQPRPEPTQDAPTLQPDRVSLSPDAQSALGTGQGSAQSDSNAPPLIGSRKPDQPGQTSDKSRSAKKKEPGQSGTRTGQAAPRQPGQLSEQQRRMVAKLAARDREVRAHEAAHQAAGGSMVGAASFDYQTGPDGRSYAIGGQVPIQLSPGRTPQETIARAEQARAAALAPADPSEADLTVAADAAQMELQARAQEVQQQRDAMQAALQESQPSSASALLTAARGLAVYQSTGS
jgi:hypothetical protein